MGDIDFHTRAIEQIKTLGEIISGFLAKICDSPAFEAGGTSDEIADRLAIGIATALAGRFWSHEGVSIEEFLRAAVGEESIQITVEQSDKEEGSSREKIQRDLGTPPVTWVGNVMSTLPMSELQRLLREVMPGLCKSVEISTEAGQGAHTDKGRRANRIRDCINNELMRRREYRVYVATIVKSKEDPGKRGSSSEQALCKRLFEARPVKEDIDSFLCWWSSCLYVDDSSGVEQKKIITAAIKSGNADEIVRDEVIRELERIPGKRLGFKIKLGNERKADAKRNPPPKYDSLMAGHSIPCESPYPKTRHPRLSYEAWNTVGHMSDVLGGPWKDFPFPKGKVTEEFDQYADKDLARLVDNLFRACYMLESIISEPLSEELLHYYVYVALPCQSRVLSLYQENGVRVSSAKGPREWEGMREALKDALQYGPEPIMNLIITDMTYRNPKLADQVERLCLAVVREAVETDEYFGRLVELAPNYWNEKEYEPRIRKFVACLKRLHYKLNHIGQLLHKDLTAGKTTKRKIKAKVPVARLVEQGESHTVEFKETLEYDTRGKGKNKDILLSSLKTIAGFLNAAGGTLLIGVDDSGETKGIDRDLRIMKHGNNDKFELKIRNFLKNGYNPQPIGKVGISFEKFAEGTICRIDVQASEDITHLNNKVYVRDGNRTQLLEGRTLTDWIQERKRTQ